MSLLYYQLGEQLMLTEEISLVVTVKLYYTGIPCLSLTGASGEVSEVLVLFSLASVLIQNVDNPGFLTVCFLSSFILQNSLQETV